MIHHVTPSSKYSSNTSNTSQSAGAASHAAQSLVVNATGNGPPPPGPGAQPSPPGVVATASGPGAAAAATTASETNNLFGRIKKACSVKTKFATSSLKHSLQSHQQQQQQNPVTVTVPPPPPLKPVNSSKGVVNPPSKAMLRSTANSSVKSKGGEPKVPIGTPLTIATAAQLSSSVSSGSSSSSSSSSASSGVPPVITGAVTKSPAIGANCSPSKQLLNSLFSSATPLQDQDRGYHLQSQQQQMNNSNGVQRLNNSRQQPPPLPPSTLPLAPANEMAPTEPQQQQLKSCPLGAISPDSLLLLSTNVTLRRKTPKKMVVVGTAFSPPLETTLGSPEVSPPKQLSPSTPAQHRGRVTSTTSPPSSSGHNQLTGGTDSLELLSLSASSAAAAAETSNRPGDTTSAANGTVVTAAPSADHPKQFDLALGSSAVEQQQQQQQQQLATVCAGEQTATSTFEDVFCKFCCGAAGGVEALERQKSCRHSAPEAVLGMFLFAGSF